MHEPIKNSFRIIALHATCAIHRFDLSSQQSRGNLIVWFQLIRRRLDNASGTKTFSIADAEVEYGYRLLGYPSQCRSGGDPACTIDGDLTAAVTAGGRSNQTSRS
jgi:hypothetical protein